MQFEWWRPDFMRHIFRNGKFWSEFCCMILWLASFARVAVCAFGKSLPIFQVCGFQLNAWINHSNFAKGSNCHQHSTAIVTGFCENRQEILNLFAPFLFLSERDSSILFGDVAKGRIFSEKYWYYFHCPKNVLCSILGSLHKLRLHLGVGRWSEKC